MSEDPEVEETHSGLKKEGDWEEVAEFAREVEEAMEEAAEDGSVEKFEEWRPREEEDESDVKEKTVKSAMLKENGLEKESDGVTKDLRDASEKVAEAGKRAAKMEGPEEELKDASKDAAKPFYTRFARAFRRLESFVYSKISLRFNPYYLDTEDFSVDMKKKRNGDYEMDVSIPEKETRNELKKRFEEDKG
ncbi:MAG: DUF5828 family protein [Candidatus Nanohaloarchaea archaeon]